MSVKASLLRADDLLNLQIEAVNMRLDTTTSEAPVLVVENVQIPAFLVVTFPPQSISEGAYYESAHLTQSQIENPPNRPDPDQDALDVPTALPGRLGTGQKKVSKMSSPSRLVFKIPAEARIPYTLAGLTDWSKLELSLNGIAAIGASPTADEIAKAPIIQAPSATETAIELPYRLWISPNGDAVWDHRDSPFVHKGRTELWHTRLLKRALDIKTPTELSKQNTASFRAIWSENYNGFDPLTPFNPDDGLGRTAMSAQDRSQIVVLTSSFHGYESDGFILFSGLGGLSLGSAKQTFFSGAALTQKLGSAAQSESLSPFQFPFNFPYVPQPFEAEQMMLTPLGGWLKSRGAWNPPHRVRRIRRFPPVFSPDIGILQSVFTANIPVAVIPPVEITPRPPLFAPPASMTATGVATTPSTLFSDSATSLALQALQSVGFEPNNLSSPLSSSVGVAGNIDVNFVLPDVQLNLSEWVHVATQGRDHYVKIVYEGVLKGFGHRAALIKVTERKFLEHDGIVEAHLVQRQYVVVREPEKRFDASNRANPFKRVLMTTLVTPDIKEPQPIPGAPNSFWVKVGNAGTDNDYFRFHGKSTDVLGNEVDFTAPMIFVSISDIKSKIGAIAIEFNQAKYIDLRNLRIPGQKLAYAEAHSDPAKRTDNTTLVTNAVNFVLDSAGDPKMLKADVLIKQVQELVGSNATTTIRLFEDYLQKGLDDAANVTGAFAEVVKQDLSKYTPSNPFAGILNDAFGVEFSSDKAGGFATPNMGVSTLTRQLGPLAGKVADAVSNVFNPDDFFKGFTAELFGAFDLAKLLPTGSHGENAPQLKTKTEDIPGGKKLIVTLDWLPAVQNLDLGIAAFIKDHNATTKLVIHGQIEKPLKLDSLGAPISAGVVSDITGTLNDFQISVLKSVFINFSKFSFEAKTGKKVDVNVALDSAKPLEFANDLAFIEEIRNAIPPGLFGDGPSLDISPTGIRAGFAFALPPIAVGVFSLKDISLGAALTLPFLNGRPSFDFNISTREHPFQLIISFFGGGGFFHMEIDTAGMKQLEVSLEFGAAASIDIGVASGEVHIMAGIYFSLQRKEGSSNLSCTLTGFLRLGGSLNVLGIIKVSVEFNLSFTYKDPGKCYGRATLTVHVEVLFFSASVELTVEKVFGGNSGDPKFRDLIGTIDIWSEYANAFA